MKKSRIGFRFGLLALVNYLTKKSIVNQKSIVGQK